MNRFLYHIALFIIVLSGHHNVCAQKQQAVADTIRLLSPAQVNAAGVTGPVSNRRFSAGTRAEVFSAERLQPFKDQSLSDYLQRNSAVYMKEYGKGMGAYISVRGTSASHTSVQWNGMSMDLPTMGQTDFSHLPLFFFDAMDLHIGGGSALYGNGSIGGSVQLATRPEWQSGLHAQLKLGAGSFGHYFSGANLRYGSRGWESRTAALYSSARNQFMFTNNTRPGKPRERQQHAAYNHWGVLQEFYKKVGHKDELSLHLWYMDFDRDIQPSVSNNNRPETYTSLYDNNFKLSGQYKGAVKNFKYSANVAYSYDNESYEKDIIAADRVMALAEGEYSRRRVTIKGGANVMYVHPTGKAFDAAVKEWRSDVYGLLLWKPLPHIAANAGLRQSFVSDLSLAPDPFLGAQWAFLHFGAHALSLRGAFSQSHKIPTLNDRYWGGSNTYLRAERASTWESGLDYEAGAGRWNWALHGTVYYSHVKDWIRWFPAGVVWRPQNIPLVDASGVEAAAHLQGSAGPVQLSFNSNYAYTGVTVKEGLWDRDPGVGHQLAYQPYHCFSAIITGAYRFLSLEIQSRYTGERTTTDIHDTLPGYQLWNAQLTYTGAWGGHKYIIQVILNNIFDKDYQNVKFYAMPGRNIMVNVEWRF